VDNVIVWDGVSPYTTPFELVEIPESTMVNIGFLYQDGQFIDPNPPVIEETQEAPIA